MRYYILFCLLTFSLYTRAQTMTVITTLTNGQRDTVKFGFHPDATLSEDTFLGEQNLFMTPVNGYEGRILQRDSSHFSCAVEFNNSRIYYPANFDSKVNYRNPSDTSLQNRLFELWYSDRETDSLELICDIPISSFLLYALHAPTDCFGDHHPSPLGLFVIQDDTTKHIKGKLQLGLGIKQYIFITKPNITLTALDEKANDKSEMSISLYPNPTYNTFSIKFNHPEELTEIFVMDITGCLIEHIDSIPITTEINLEPYAKGVYFVTFVLKTGKRLTKNIVKL